MMDPCWAENYCKSFNDQRSNCHEFCIPFVQLKVLYELSNLPVRYQFPMELYPDAIDRQSFTRLRDIKDGIEEWVKYGSGLFIWSANKGNGKTSWAAKLMNEYFRHVAIMNNMRCRGLYVYVPAFLDELRANMDKKSERTQEIREHLFEADLVIWDDIGAETPTEWVRQELLVFINHRESNGLSQIYTSNISLDELSEEQWLGSRVSRRIRSQCEVINLQGKEKSAWSSSNS